MDAQLIYAIVMLLFLIAIPFFWLITIKVIAKIFAKEFIKQLKKHQFIK